MFDKVEVHRSRVIMLRKCISVKGLMKGAVAEGFFRYTERALGVL